MTIAMCYVSPEGVVLGADSTATQTLKRGWHFYNNAQKVFEIGENGTLGLATWGLSGLGDVSYRTLVARFADKLASEPPASVADAARRWRDFFWKAYRQSGHATPRTVGFFIGGYVEGDRKPAAFQTVFDTFEQRPEVKKLRRYGIAGAPHMVYRLLYGMDGRTFRRIIESDKWSGCEEDLREIRKKSSLIHPNLPLRDTVDFVYFCIYSTIKGYKFSSSPQICGGPIEIAAITTDRRFRWIRHKQLHSAIEEGGL